jgi:membrane carboxypeptidase/penicillin-binding protein
MLRKFNEYGSFRGIKRTGYGFSMRSARRQQRNKQFRKLFRMGLIGGGILFVFGIIVFIQMLFQLPDVELINTFVPNETTKIYSADGVVLAELHQEENRIIVPTEKMSPYLKAAVACNL